VAEKGFYILPSELFANVRRRAGADENLNETLERVFRHIEGSAVGADSEDDLKGLFDDFDVNSAKLGNTVARRNEKLVKLLDAIGDLELGRFEDHTIDAFGDAYEYLMQMYASSAGKSGGEFYTPQEVSELLARITVVGKTEVDKVYDPACGSGSLLLKAADEAGTPKLAIYGQEMDVATWALARMNMILHGHPTAELWRGNTLAAPHFKNRDDSLRTFDFAVANPPFSAKAWSSGLNPEHDEFGRFG